MKRLLIGLVLAAASTSALATDAPADKGEAIFQDRCSMCHLDAGQGQGPNLKGVVERKAGEAPGFAYTAALKSSGLTWTPANLDAFLQGPAKLVPGTAMPVSVPTAEERQDLIAYLATLK